MRADRPARGNWLVVLGAVFALTSVGCGRSVEPPPTVDGPLPPRKLDLAAFPDAVLEGDSNTSGAIGTLATANYSTDAPLDQVARFYEEQYPDAEVEESLEGKSRSVSITVSGPPDMRTIEIMQREGSPQVAIRLMRSVAPPSAP